MVGTGGPTPETMPTDSSASATQAKSPPASPSPEPELPRTSSSPLPSPSDPLPPWALRSSSPNGHNSTGSDNLFFGRPRPAGVRRLSTPYSRTGSGNMSHHHHHHHHSNIPFGARLMQGSVSAMNGLLRLGYSMTPIQRLVAGLGGVAVLALVIVFLVFSHRIFAALRPVAGGWRALPGGWVILFLLTSATAFPPMIGYSTTVMIAGFVFGFPAGWPIVAGATVAGSTASFLASRTVFSGYVHRLVGEDRRFVALGQVLRRDGLPVLAAIRFCPLPFSLSNGFLATIPSISPAAFALATAISTPKLLIHVFIGDRLAQLAGSDDMPLSTRVVNYLSILFGSVLGVTVGWLVYRRTMLRAKEIALEEAAAAADDDDDADAANAALLTDEFGYDDVEEGILGPLSSSRRMRSGESDAAALMDDDDDISLWGNTEEVLDAYRDADGTDGYPPSASKRTGVR
ncbi:tlg2-vesicle protein of [Xylariaceae sp. FL0594]|nr:tlg2-vesicle protein of [Xylariaceae sp. FL0594]